MLRFVFYLEQWNIAVKLLQDMYNLYGVMPDVVSYGTTICACGKSAQWDMVILLFEQMKAARLDMTVDMWATTICDTVITACEKSKQWDRAQELLSCKKALLGSVEVESYNKGLNKLKLSQADLFRRKELQLNPITITEVLDRVTSAIDYDTMTTASGPSKSLYASVPADMSDRIVRLQRERCDAAADREPVDSEPLIKGFSKSGYEYIFRARFQRLSHAGFQPVVQFACEEDRQVRDAPLEIIEEIASSSSSSQSLDVLCLTVCGPDGNLDYRGVNHGGDTSRKSAGRLAVFGLDEKVRSLFRTQRDIHAIFRSSTFVRLREKLQVSRSIVIRTLPMFHAEQGIEAFLIRSRMHRSDLIGNQFIASSRPACLCCTLSISHGSVRIPIYHHPKILPHARDLNSSGYAFLPTDSGETVTSFTGETVTSSTPVYRIEFDILHDR